MLMNGKTFGKSEGLPAYFSGFTLMRGSTRIPVTNEPLDTGDVFNVR
jgi:hypothetical protein